MHIVDALGFICFSKKTTDIYVDRMVCNGFPCDSPSPLLQNLPKQTISDTRIHPKTTRQRWNVVSRPTPEQFSWVEGLDWMMIEAPNHHFIMSQYISSFPFRSFVFFVNEGMIGSKWLMLWGASASTWEQLTYNQNGSEWRVCIFYNTHLQESTRKKSETCSKRCEVVWPTAWPTFGARCLCICKACAVDWFITGDSP